jgi:MFS family permease
VLATSQATELGAVLGLWILAGFGNAVGTVSYESMLQEQTPDLYRGRVMATSEAVLNMAYLGGASAAAWLSTHAGIRTSYASSGALLLLAAVMSWRLIRRVGAPTLLSAQLHLADAEELRSRTPPSETVSARRTSS